MKIRIDFINEATSKKDFMFAVTPLIMITDQGISIGLFFWHIDIELKK